MMSASYGCNVYGFELQHDYIDVASKAASFDDGISHIHQFQNSVSDTSSEMTIKYRDNMQCDGNFGFTREDCPWCDFNKIATEKTFFNSTTLDTAFLLGRGKERAIVGTVTSENAPIIKLLKIDIQFSVCDPDQAPHPDHVPRLKNNSHLHELTPIIE